MLRWAENGKFGWAKTENFVGNFSERRVVPYAEDIMTTNEKTIKLIGALIWAVDQLSTPDIKEISNKRIDAILDAPTD